MADTGIEPNVGQRLRLLRDLKGLSLRALAERSGMSINAISRIERGENSPTVTTLHLLANGLGVTITDFFDSQSEQAVVLIRKDRRLRSQHGGVVMESLGIGLRNQQLEPFLMHVEPGSGTQSQSVTHAGEEFVHCLEGEIVYCVGREQYVLTAGDSLLFDASQQHCFINAGAVPARFMLVFQAAEGSLPARQAHLSV